MDDARKQLVAKIKESTNVLVTVSANPSVDQLAACIGFTLVLNKMGKHATAVFSGKVPDTIEFLKPTETLENNTDSLRDFIISLDKSKADKLKYKVEDKLVRIFITPYKTSIGQSDLEFSQGDFNVDVVIALGVHEQQDLDQAITAHGRILHDATVVAVNRDPNGGLGGINWADHGASSLSEMLVSMTEELKPDALDEQIATAFLTGIVAETDRFSNEKTSSATMTLSAKLMAAGANQQLVATKLQEDQNHPIKNKDAHFDPLKINELAHEDEAEQAAEPGALRVNHDDAAPAPEPQSGIPLIPTDDHNELPELDQNPASNHDDPEEEYSNLGRPKLVLQPPTLGGTLTANGRPEDLEPSMDPLGALTTEQQPLLSHNSGPAELDHHQPTAPPPPPPIVEEPVAPISLPVEPPAPEPVIEPEPAPAPPPPPEPVAAPVVPDFQLPPAPAAPSVSDVLTPPAIPEPLQPLTPLVDESPQTLKDLEESVHSPHLGSVPVEPPPPDAPDTALPEPDFTLPPAPEPKPGVDEARDAVLDAINASSEPTPLEPIAALNANPVNLDLGHEETPAPEEPAVATEFNPEAYGINATGATGTEFKTAADASVDDPTAPPPVPPPMMPPLPDAPTESSDNKPPADNPFNLPQ